MNTKTKRRYNLHYRIRKQGFRFHTTHKTIFVPYNDQSLSKQATALRDEFGYGVQTEII